MMKTIDGITLEIPDDVYDPAEDSFLLAENITPIDNSQVLEIGSGSGYVSIYLEKNFPHVEYFCVDINLAAAKITNINAKRNSVDLHVLNSDLFCALKDSEVYFDIIMFNSPYLPISEPSDLAKAWSGGEDGLLIVSKFLQEIPLFLKPTGRCYLVVSSLTDLVRLSQLIADINYSSTIVDKITEGRETIYLYLLEKQ